MTSLSADVCLCRCGTQRKGQRTTRGALIDATLCFCDATSPERDARLATTKGFGRTKKKELSRNLLAVRSRISIYYTPTLYGKPFPVLRQLVSPLSSKKKRKKKRKKHYCCCCALHISCFFFFFCFVSLGGSLASLSTTRLARYFSVRHLPRRQRASWRSYRVPFTRLFLFFFAAGIT